MRNDKSSEGQMNAVVVSFVRLETHFKFRPDTLRIRKTDPTIIDPNQFMYHSLIRPLTQKRCYWIVAPIKDEQQRWDIGSSEIVETWLRRGHLVLCMQARCARGRGSREEVRIRSHRS